MNTALEFFPLNPPAEPFRAPGSMSTPYPDLRHYTLRDYGNRVGIFRVMKALEKFGIIPTVAVNAAVAQRYPTLIEEVVKRDWEIIAGGLDMGHLHHGGLEEAEEAALVGQCVEILRKKTGQPVKGWLSPARSQSMKTMDLVAAVLKWTSSPVRASTISAIGSMTRCPIPSRRRGANSRPCRIPMR